jgi:hypothetical protein
MILYLRILTFAIILLFNVPCYGQDVMSNDYLNITGDYAAVFNGRTDVDYNSANYDNYPYFFPKKLASSGSFPEDFVVGTLTYNGTVYKNVGLRLDLFKEELIILSHQKGFGIVLEPQKVNEAVLYGLIFFWNSNSNIGEGYYMQLYKGDFLKLVYKEKFELNSRIRDLQSINHFSRDTKFYLLYKGKYTQVKDKNSFIKLFPGQKSRINEFVKKQKLNFKREREKSLIELSAFCEQFLLSGN